MPIYHGPQKLGAIYRGGTAIARVYHGAQLVFDNTATDPGGGGGGPQPSDKWRVYFHSVNGGGRPVIYDMEMRASIGGADQCTGGTATANGGNNPSHAFDADPSTYWFPAPASPWWLQYTFASAVSVSELSIKCGLVSDQPAHFELQRWDGAAWVTVFESFGFNWAANTYKAFSNGSTYLGPERVTDPSFDNPAAWTTSGGWSVSGGNLVASNAADRAAQSGVFESGKRYFLRFPYTRPSTGAGSLRIRTEANTTLLNRGTGSLSGFVDGILVANGTQLRIEAEDAVFTGSIPEITVREVFEA